MEQQTLTLLVNWFKNYQCTYRRNWFVFYRYKKYPTRVTVSFPPSINTFYLLFYQFTSHKENFKKLLLCGACSPHFALLLIAKTGLLCPSQQTEGRQSVIKQPNWHVVRHSDSPTHESCHKRTAVLYSTHALDWSKKDRWKIFRLANEQSDNHVDSQWVSRTVWLAC